MVGTAVNWAICRSISCLHCGQSTAGCFLRTLSAVDIASGWWEGEALADTLPTTTQAGLERIRRRLRFACRAEIHADNDSDCCKRSRPVLV